jgi:endo-1,4-beta-mannosidase
MLTANQEAFCQNIEIKKMSQYEAYLNAYPHSQKWKRASVDEVASRLANDIKILSRRQELRETLLNDARAEAKWTRTEAHNTLTWLIEKAKEEIEQGEMSGPCVSAIVNSTKELNTIFGVAEKAEGGGVLEDILSAVRGIDND